MLLSGGNPLLKSLQSSNTPTQSLASQYGKFNLSHIHPTAMDGGMMGRAHLPTEGQVQADYDDGELTGS